MFYLKCALSIILVLITCYCIFAQGNSEYFSNSSSIQFELKNLLDNNDLKDNVQFGYWYFPTSQTIVGLGDRDRLEIQGNGDVMLYLVNSFTDYYSHKYIVCKVDYEYVINSDLVKKICYEYIESGFLIKKFAEEKEKIVDGGPQRCFFIKIKGNEYEKIFTDPSDENKGEKNLGIPKEMEKLQCLYDQIIRERDNKGTIGRSDMYTFSKKGRVPLELKNLEDIEK